MSRLEELLQTLCPDGVEYVTLGDISNIDSSGVDKKIIAGEKDVFLLNYMDVYRNRLIDKSVIRMQVTASDSKIQSCDIQQGDIFLTPTSETIEDLAHSAVAIETIVGAVYSYHIMRLRLKKKSMMTSFYLNYLFRSEYFQNQIQHYASGLTRFGLSRGKWLSLNIPLPPLPVQEEIVRILDTFSDVVSELEAEQAARVRQYEHYQRNLLEFVDNPNVEWKKIGDIADCLTGATPSTTRKEFWENGTVPWMNSGEVNLGQVFETENKITQLGYENSSTKMVPINTVVVALAGQGKTRGKVAITRIPLCTNQSLCSIIPTEEVNSNYLYYYLKTQYQNLRTISSGDGTRGGLNLKMIKGYEVPIPPLEVQEKIVSILDRFDGLVNDLKSGLPAEIALRRKQYETYRDKLLTFTRRA
jgi:type I restriction enzyme S subunit